MALNGITNFHRKYKKKKNDLKNEQKKEKWKTNKQNKNRLKRPKLMGKTNWIINDL